MSASLRPYQQQAVDTVRDWVWQGPFRKALQAPTGAGKTRIMAELLRDPLRQAVYTHRRVLLDQLARVLDEHGIQYSMVASGYKPTPKATIHLCMLQTATRRKTRLPVDVVHVDEIHCAKGGTYRELYDAHFEQGGSLLGYTATPHNLAGIVDDVHSVVGVRQLVDEGYLVEPRVFGCGMPDMRLVEKLKRDASGEYSPSDVNKLIKPQVIFGQVLENYRRLNTDGRPFVLFAHSVKASIWWAQHLSGEGVRTAHVDGNDVWVDGTFYKSDRARREQCFAELRDGTLKGVSNRFVLREGVDEPCLGHAIITCPFGLRSSWVQSCGRVLRPYPNRDYGIIQDHSGSWINHPALDSDEPWNWESPPGLTERQRGGQMRADEIPEPIMCPKCMGVRGAGDTCPYCGHRCAKRGRYVIQVDGTLQLVQGKAYVPRKVRVRPGQAAEWRRHYLAAKRHKPHRTFEQIYAYYAYKNGWEWLPRNLPLMPRSEADFFLPVGQVPMTRLHPE